MKLLELLDVKHLRSLPPGELVQTLIDRKFFKAELGRGQRGIAFEMDDGSVLKAWVSDPGYEAFVRFAATNPNPHFVKALSPVKKFKSASVEWKYVRVEKLKPLGRKWKEGGKSYTLDTILQDVCAYYNEYRYPPFDPVEDVIEGEAGIGDPSDRLVSFCMAIELLAEQALESGLELDLHPRNLGTRDGITPVMLDPLHARDDEFDDVVVDLEKVLER